LKKKPFKNYIFFSLKDLKENLLQLVPAEQKRVAAFRKQFGNVKIGEVTIDQVKSVTRACEYKMITF
jgi:spore cortex formation protein SpoVR/YcgB (stage V sporulation)